MRSFSGFGYTPRTMEGSIPIILISLEIFNVGSLLKLKFNNSGTPNLKNGLNQVNLQKPTIHIHKNL